MTAGHQRQREALGAYVLGALDPADRHDVEDHLARCSSCRDEVAALSALPQLLGRLSPEEAADERLVPPAGSAPRFVLAAAAETARLDRRLRRWRRTAAVAAAAAVVSGVLLVADPFGGGPELAPPIVAEVERVAADASTTAGSASAYAWEWGTTVELEVADLPARDRYVVVTIAEDGRREQAGTWGPTATRSARLRSASSIDRDDLSRVEVTDSDGAVLFAFDFDA